MCWALVRRRECSSTVHASAAITMRNSQSVVLMVQGLTKLFYQNLLVQFLQKFLQKNSKKLLTKADLHCILTKSVAENN